MNPTNAKAINDGKYSLRQRNKRSIQISEGFRTKSMSKDAISKQKSKSKVAPLSKYRRKTANARERSRMQEINSAFETLRRCVPLPITIANDYSSNEKLTKITTLRLAMKYIQTLNEALLNPTFDASFLLSKDSSDSSEFEANLESNSISQNNRLKERSLQKPKQKYRTQTKPLKHVSRKKKTIALKRDNLKLDLHNSGKHFVSIVDDNYSLPSDDETSSFPIAMPTPVETSKKSYRLLNKSPFDFGLSFETDSDSFEVFDPYLSPLKTFETLHPFDCLFDTDISEQTSLDSILT